MATTDSELTVRATGQAFETPKYDLRRVDLVITNYRILLDQTIPFVIGQQRLTDRTKELITYEVEFRHGSLELLNRILVAAPPVIAAVSADGGFQIAYQLAKLISAVVTFRRAWANIQKLADGTNQADEPRIKLDINIENVNQAANGTINVNPVILLAADASKHTVDRVVAGIDGEKLDTVSIDGGRQAKTVLTQQDQAILGSDLEELPTTVDIIGRLYEVNFNTRKGWLVTDNGRVPVTWNESNRSAIKEHADKERVAFRVRPLIDHRRFDTPVAGYRAVGYHIVRVWEPQGSLLERGGRKRKRARTK